MALKQNHVVRISEMKIEEKQHAKDVARSAYFPTISNQSTLVHLTDTQFIQIAPGSLGTVNGTPIPTQPATHQSGRANACYQRNGSGAAAHTAVHEG